MKKYILTLPAKWSAGLHVDSALEPHRNLFDSKPKQITIVVPSGCYLKIGACLRLLSISNQLALAGATVELSFEDGPSGAMGYLSRMGFFECLSPAITVRPDRPEITGRSVFGGTNRALVEIVSLSAKAREKSLPGRLAETAAKLHSDPKKGERLGDAVYTVFSELVGNVYDHSGSTLDGYAALQTYPKGRRGPTVEIAVSDSGLGILSTLRAGLAKASHKYAELDDAELLFKAISEGVSKNGAAGYGCGLRISAQKALIFGANLEIRLPECRMNFVPGDAQYSRSTMAYGFDGLPHIEGTHVCFDFRLDK